MRTATLIMLVSLSLLPSPAVRADWMLALPGATSRVVATRRHAAVIRNQEVLVLRDDGRVISRLGSAEVASKSKQGPLLKDAAQRTLDRLEVPEIDRGTDYTDDLVEDESRLGERRFWRASGRATAADLPQTRIAVAASADEIWIANSRGIFRVEDAGSIAPAFDREWTGARIIASRGRVVVDKGSALALLSTSGAEPRLIDLPAPPEHLAISADGARMAWTTAAVLHIVGVDGTVETDAPGDIVHLAFCGETLTALLASSAVLAIPPDGRTEIRSAPPHVRKLVCSSVPDMPWVAVGDTLWLSSDQSQHWSPLPSPTGKGLVDVAISDSHVWVATSAGLYVSVDASTAESARGGVERSRRAERPSRAWLSWLMPNVSVRAAATFAPTGRRLEGFAFAAFPLGSQGLPVTAVSLPESSEAPEPAPAIALREIESQQMV